MSSRTNSPDHSSQEDETENHQITFSESRHGFDENTSKNTVNLSELRNDECVSDADVSIPLTSVDEVQDDMFETNNSAWRKNNNIESIVSDSDSEEVENVLREDNGKHMDGLVDDARKKVEAPPKKTPRKTRIWLGRKADSPKRNVAFFPERRFTTLIGRIMKNWSIKMPIAKRVDDSRMVIGIFVSQFVFSS
ncbi:hypothetical protein Tco_0919327 [Tanacetum coccineum]